MSLIISFGLWLCSWSCGVARVCSYSKWFFCSSLVYYLYYRFAWKCMSTFLETAYLALLLYIKLLVIEHIFLLAIFIKKVEMNSCNYDPCWKDYSLFWVIRVWKIQRIQALKVGRKFTIDSERFHKGTTLLYNSYCHCKVGTINILII